MNTSEDLPLGKVFSAIAKAYVGTFAARLSHLPINRYYYALVLIDQYEGDLSQTCLGEELYLDKASVVRMLDYLQEEDCIIREPNPNDRRAHILKLTPKAIQMIPEIKAAIAETNSLCAKGIGDETVKSLIKDFDAILSNLQTTQGNPYQIHFTKRENND